MWAAQTTLLAPTVTLSPMVIGKKAMFPWQATNLDYTGFWTTILLRSFSKWIFITGMSHSWLNWKIRSMLVVNMCQQCQWCLSTARPVYKGSQNGHVHWLFHCFLNILIHQHSSMAIHFSCCIFLHISLLQNVSCHPCACQPCSHLVLLVWGS